MLALRVLLPLLGWMVRRVHFTTDEGRIFMNRLPALFRRPTAAPFQRQLGHPPFRLSDFHTPDLAFPHSLFIPEHYEAGYEYPVVVWLHSDASSEAELAEIMPSLSQRNYVAIAPRGIHACRKKPGFYEWSLTDHAVTLAEEMIFEAVAHLDDRLSINPRRIFLAGYGKGGTLAQTIGLHYPEKFAGVLSMNGPFPTHSRPLARWKSAKSLPILWMHGNQSRQCSMDAMCDMLQVAFTSALMIHPIQFATGDDLPVEMLNKANRFMMQIVTNQPIEMHEPVSAE